MKIKYIALCLLLALVSCQRDEEMEIGQVSIGNERLEASYSSVLIGCSFQTNVTIKNVQAYLSTEADFSSVKSYSLTEKSKNTFGATIEGLKDASTYYVRYKISNRWSSKVIDKVSEFKTIPYTIPTVQTNEVTDVTYNSAKVVGTIKENGGQEITERGVVYSKSPNPSIENGTKVESLEKAESYACTLMDLEYVTTYYVRAYAINEKGVAYGEERSLTTLSTNATVGEISVIEIGGTTTTIQAELLTDGGASIEKLGICYNMSGEPTINDSIVLSSENKIGIFQCTIDNLSGATTYYVRAFATNANGTVYSEQISFKTEATIATITTTQAINISYTSATIGGKVMSDGGASVTERGICYSTSANPTTANTKISTGSGLGEFTCNLIDLQDGVTYYARAYAVNAKGTAYGEEVRFTTKTKTIATVATTPATNVSYTSATVGGNVTDDGGANVTERGVVYSTNQNPTIADSKITNGSGLGEFMCNLTNLQYETTYYVRAYAVNEKGTSYGEEVSFTTKQQVIPTIVTSQPTNIAYTSVTVGGNVTDDGGLEVTERGVVYSTNQSPTTADSKITNGSGLGEFTCNLTDLQDGTTYYVRAYAVNAKGIAYGNEVSFTTIAKTVATVITKSATNVSYTSAAVGGNVTDNGGLEVTERGVVYSTNQNPTTADSKITNGSGLGEFMCNLTNLQYETTYYVRAYAVNAKGIAYGNEVSFTTTSLKEGEGIENGYVYVDLGLSVKWATMNVGASKPEEYGDYFAWGETTTKTTYDMLTYKYYNLSSGTITKYNNSSYYGTVDNKTQLDLSDDAARANWGGSWRMPTDAEFTELREQCTWTIIQVEDNFGGIINVGYNVTSKSNGNSIFLPAAGYRYESSLDYAGSNGYYWSSSLCTDGPYGAWVMFFNSIEVSRGNWIREYGGSVRPVCP